MKQLPCNFCKGPAWGKFGPIEVPLVVGRISHFPYKYKCSRCKRLNIVGAIEYNRLPNVQAETPADA